MAKKKKKTDGFDNGMDLIVDRMMSFMENNNISTSDLLMAMEKVQKGEYLEALNQNYDYAKPDYKAKVHPLSLALQPLMEIYDITDINACWKEAAEKLKEESPETVREECLNALYWILAYQEDFINDPAKKRNSLALFTVLQVMISLGVKDVTDAIIELLRQDVYFYEFFMSGNDEDMALAISQLSGDSLDKLEKYMYETGRIPSTKCIVADGVVQMALANPMLKLGVVAWFARVLQRYSEILVYPTNIDHITYSISQLKAKELVPYVMKLYEINDVPYICVKSEEDLKHLMEAGTDERIIGFNSLSEIFAAIEKSAKEEKGKESFWAENEDYLSALYKGWEGFDNEERYKDEEGDDTDGILIDEEDNDEFFTLEVSLNESPVEVKRTFKVPSNIRLSVLAEILIKVMGWEGYHLNQFIKGRTFYSDRDTVEDSWNANGYENIDYRYVALNEVLKRKGSNIIWEYDFGDSWQHTVKVVGREKWTNKSKIEVLEAVNACPPEDCGGVWGYQHLLDVLSDKKDPEYDEMKEWVGRGFNPNKVSVAKLNKAIAPFNKEI